MEDWLKLKINDRLYIGEDYSIFRVPGGWICCFEEEVMTDQNGITVHFSKVFVPYSVY